MPVIFTIGTNSRSIEEFINLLKEHQIRILVDVRRFPTSRFEHFKKKNLSLSLENSGIDYVYSGDALGGFREEGYQNYIKTEQFKKALQVLKSIARDKQACIMCAEKESSNCHRKFITQVLSLQGWQIIDIV
ncbi:MAG: DUF488 domain-containing protein [Candidatus Omnitrophica bacterium]|nr:DUF488 domain-containing protein [Candidatus Omnitrophota bacterium]